VSGDRPTTNEAQRRLDMLERKIADFLQPGNFLTPASSSDGGLTGGDTPLQHATGHLENDGLNTSYRGASHWASVLEHVRTLLAIDLAYTD
jgi:hypothetical protein